MSRLTGFARILWEVVADSHAHKVINSAFVQAVKSGRLPRNIFNRFLSLDHGYLVQYGRAAADIYRKIDAPHRPFLQGVKEATDLERQRIHAVLKKENFSLDIRDETWCAYGAHICNVAQAEAPAVGVAAIFTCILFFDEMGADFRKLNIPKASSARNAKK